MYLHNFYNERRLLSISFYNIKTTERMKFMRKRKNVIKISLILLGIILATSSKECKENPQMHSLKLMKQDISYTESTNKLRNPDRGFYHQAIIRGTPKGFDYSEVENAIEELQKSDRTLIHLRIDISKLSGRANGKQDLNLSNADKSDINDAFDLIRQNKLKAIVRISYDYDGDIHKEPDTLEMILEHIKQFKPIFETNKDVITVVEAGFIGMWGEMHGSDYTNQEDISTVIKEVLHAVPSSIMVNVRTLDMYMNLFGTAPISKKLAYNGKDESRLGIFNDGYLGSETDLGTYQNREEALKFLEAHAKYTIFGGETATPDNPYNDIENVQEEMFRTHTTYLNYEWNPEITQMKWENTIYNGKNSEYKGQTAQKYIEDHLGYRFVLKESKISQSVAQGKKVLVSISIENTGFGNVVNEKKVQLVLKKGIQSYTIDTNINVRKWDSNRTATECIKVAIPDNIKEGEWKLYLKIVDKENEQYTIQFANEGVWNAFVNANYIGKFEVVKIQEKEK